MKDKERDVCFIGNEDGGGGVWMSPPFPTPLDAHTSPNVPKSQYIKALVPEVGES